MRLKTKLVLAIASLVLLISALLSVVYFTQLLDAAVDQTYQTNRMVANQIRLALLQALETGLRDREVNPNDPAELRDLQAQAIQHSASLQAALESVNRYSLTVYDVNIADNQSTVLKSTNPDNEGKQLPGRPDYETLKKLTRSS